MTKRLYVLSLVCLGVLMFGVAMTAFRRHLVQVTYAASPYNPNELSYGLYWFGLNGANQKFVPGETNPYFAPAKPTLIFAHGWQPFLSNNLPNFDFNGTDTAAGWINAGWNVGIFVWNQFSDETTGVSGDWFGDGPPPQGVLDAEAKIWTANGPRGMRWRDWDDYIDGYGDAPPATPSAGELFYQIYVAALTDQTYTGGVIRIAGHSLGNQMAVRLTKLVDEGIVAGNVPENLRPARVALLDPYWSPDPRSYLGNRTTGDLVREYIAELTPSGTLFEWYWSSTWTTPPQGDANDALKPMTFYAEMDPVYAIQDVDKHLAAQHLYFWSYAFAGPAPCTGEACLGMTSLLSKVSDDQLAAVMRSDYRWFQDAGQNTATPNDDTYYSILQSGAPYTVTLLTATPITQTIGSVVTITATVSGAPEGTLVSFSTDLGAISPRAVLSAGAASVQLTSDLTGTAHISATARGTGGMVQSTTVATFLRTGPNQAPVADAGSDQTVDTLATVTLSGTNSYDPDGDLPLAYLWTQTGGPAVTFTPNVSVTTFTAPSDPAVLTFTLAVTDSLGLPDPTPDEVIITVEEGEGICLPGHRARRDEGQPQLWP